ncbi:glutamate receptor 2.5-like [Tasmannia lanceolata]|uniref:glutamate receptor 2.5-like n=1 Tax=Tasmannia lanceolata TaxID=3420 RepID=UPI0040629472
MPRVLPLFLLLLLGMEVMASRGENSKIKFKESIGAVIDSTSRAGKEEKIAIEMAVEDFYKTTGNQLVLHLKDSLADPVQAAFSVLDLIKEQKVQAIIGLRTWHYAAFAAKLGDNHQIPIVSLAANAPPWPFLVRMAPSCDLGMRAVAAIVGSWQWPKVSIIYEEDNNYGAAGNIANLIDALQEVNSEVESQSVFPPFASLPNPKMAIREELDKLKKKPCRVFIVHSSLALSTHLFTEAKLMGMMSTDYVWITTDRLTKNFDSINKTVISSMQGVIGVKSYFSQTSTRFRKYYVRFRRRFRSQYPEEDNSEPEIFGLQAYDAVWAVAKAMENLQPKNKKSLHSQLENSTIWTGVGKRLLEGILASNFTGLRSEIRFSGGELVGTTLGLKIVNVVGRSYRELGLWAPKYDFYKRKDGSEVEGKNNSTSMKILGDVFWPGESSYVPRGWATPTSEKPMIIGVPANAPYEKFMNVRHNETSNELYFGGFAVDVFEKVLELLPYHLPYQFAPYNGTYDSLVEKVNLKVFDAVVGDTAIVANRCQYVEFSQPYSESGVVLVVLTEPKEGKAWIFLKPLTKKMWALTGAIILYNGVIVWLIEREDNEQLGGSFCDQIGKLMWVSFNTLFSIQGEKLHSNLSRMAMVVWLFVALVLTSSYTASFSSMLTVQQLQPSVVDVESLRKSNAIVGTDHVAFVGTFLEQVLKFDPKRIRKFTSGDDYPQALKNGSIKAAFLEVPYAKWLLGKYCKGFTMTGRTYEIGGFGFVFPKGSPFIADVSEAIVKLRERNDILRLETDLIHSSNCSSLEADGESVSLGPDGFWGLFLITGGTSTVALMIFFIRRVCYNWHPDYNPQARLVDVKFFQLILTLSNTWKKQGRTRELPERTRDEDSQEGSYNSQDSTEP